MPEAKIMDKLKREKQTLAARIAELYPRLTGQELLEIAVATRQSLSTLQRYTKEVKKLPVGEIIKTAMEEKATTRNATQAS